MHVFPAILLSFFIGYVPVQEARRTGDFLRSKIEKLENDPDFQGLTWVVQQDPSYSPFALLIAGDLQTGEKFLDEVEKTYGPPLEALVKAWRKDWADPLQLKQNTDPPCLPIAFLRSYGEYKKVYEKKFPDSSEIPPSSFLDQNHLIVTYHKGREFESKMARRGAVLKAAADQFLRLYLPAGAGKHHSAWVFLGMGAYISEIHEMQKGRKGTIYVRQELPGWRQKLPRLADFLLAQGVPLPDFREILEFGSVEEVIRKAASLAKAANTAETEILPLYQDYVRLCGYSLLLYFCSKPEAPYLRHFLSFLKDDFRGRGGGKKFQAKFKSDLATIEKGWEEFCEFKPGESIASSLPAGKSPGIAKNPKKTLPLPIPLDLSPGNLLEFRAELIRRMGDGGIEEALELFEDEGIKEIQSLGPLLLEERRLLDAPFNLYEILKRNFQPGDKFPSGFGFRGEIAKVGEKGFELKGKYQNKVYAWARLNVNAVANHIYYKLKYRDGKTLREVAISLMLSGETKRAKAILRKAAKDFDPQEETIRRLSRLIPEFEAAANEAGALREIEKVAKLSPEKGFKLISKIVSQEEIRKTRTYLRAKPFLEGVAAQVLVKRFHHEGIALLFKGKLRTGKEGKVTIQYSFKDSKELEDWIPAVHRSMVKFCRNKQKDTAEWELQEGGVWINPSGCRYHKSMWTGDISIAFTVERFPPETELEEGEKIKSAYFLAGICDDGKGNFASNFGPYTLMCFTRGSHRYSEESGPYWLDEEVEYRIEVRKTVSKIQIFTDGEEWASMDDKKLLGGRVFLYASGPFPYLISDVTIEGTLDPQWIEGKRINWIHQELKSIFGPGT